MSGVTAGLGEVIHLQDNFKLGTDQADAVFGQVFTLHDSEIDSIKLSSATLPQTQQFLGVLHNLEGATPGASVTQPVTPDSIPRLILHGRNISAVIQDSATPALGDLLTMSAATAGTLVTAATGERVWAVCKKAIASGGVGLTTKVDIILNGGLAP